MWHYWYTVISVEKQPSGTISTQSVSVEKQPCGTIGTQSVSVEKQPHCTIGIRSVSIGNSHVALLAPGRLAWRNT